MKLNISGKSVEVADEDLKKAIEEKKETFDIKVDSLVVRTTDEDSAYKENVRKEAIATGAEIGRKNLIKSLGIEGDGLHKSDETAIEAINKLMNGKVDSALKDAGKDPDKKLQEKEKDIETLRSTIAGLQSKNTELEGSFKSYKKSNIINQAMSSLIPDNVVIPKEDMLQLISGKIKAEVDDNGNIIAIGDDGQPVKDKTTLNPVPLKNVVADFFGKNPQYLKGSSGGGGGGDSKTDEGKQDLESFTKEMNEKNIRTNSAEFTAEMQVRLKAGTLKV